MFWQIGSSATLGSGTSFAGNILALTSITLNPGAAVSGRTLARNGAVTLSSNTVTACAPAIVCPPIALDDTLPEGSIGAVYNGVVMASDGLAPYTYELTSGALPTGLAIDAAGNITGTPTAIGTFNFSVTATDSNGCPGTRAYEIVIAAAGCPIITVNPATLPPATPGVAYNQAVTASGGTGPYTFAITAELPANLILNTGTGAITGTPTMSRLFSFTIQATDSLSCPGNRPYSITVTTSALRAIPALGPFGLVCLAILLAGVGLFALKGSWA